jgi:hypothetical protein
LRFGWVCWVRLLVGMDLLVFMSSCFFWVILFSFWLWFWVGFDGFDFRFLNFSLELYMGIYEVRKMVGFWFVVGLSKLEVALKNTLFFIRFHISLFFFTLFFLRFLIFFLQFHWEEQKSGIGMDGGGFVSSVLGLWMGLRWFFFF